MSIFTSVSGFCLVSFHVHVHICRLCVAMSAYVPSYIACNSCISSETVESLPPPLSWSLQWTVVVLRSFPRTAMPFSLHVNVDTCIIVAISGLQSEFVLSPPLHSSEPLDLLLRRLYDAC